MGNAAQAVDFLSGRAQPGQRIPVARAVRVLVYAEVDLNLIDGSSIWLAALAHLLGSTGQIQVAVLQRTRLHRTVVVDEAVSSDDVRLLDPWELAAFDEDLASVLADNSGPRLTSDTAARVLAHLDDSAPFDILLIRGEAVAAHLAEDNGRARRMWCYVTDPVRHHSDDDRTRLAALLRRCRRVLCQTAEARAAFVDLVPELDDDRVTLLPPIIAAVDDRRWREPNPDVGRLGYSGKFSPPYRIVEMLDAFEQIRRRLPGAEFHVVGDKFHNAPPVEGFVEEVTKRLKETPGVMWHGGLSRREANEVMATVDVASSWRAPELDNSVELSTKILEYAALGVPVLMNQAPVQARIFGDSYEGYISSAQDFVDRFTALVSSPELHRRTAERVRKVAAEFSLPKVRNRLLPVLLSDAEHAQTDREDNA